MVKFNNNKSNFTVSKKKETKIVPIFYINEK